MSVNDEERLIELKCSGSVRPSELRALIPARPMSTQIA